MRGTVAVLLLLGGEGRFFERRDVDYWGARARAAAEAAPPEPDLWADSNAPGPVKRLLGAPTRGNAEAYLAWQTARLERLRGAIAAVEEARQAAAVPESSPILYFARAGCRYCGLQDAELRGLPAERVPEGSPLWKAYGVTATPTLVVRGKVFRGLTPRKVLLRELGRG